MNARLRNELAWLLALCLPLVARMVGEGADAALERLLLLVGALVVVYAWAALFARVQGRALGERLGSFALLFVVLVPGSGAWGSALVALSFAAVFGREVFGGRAILSPALLALAFAIYAFPDAGFEVEGVLDAPSDPQFALACLVSAAAILLATRSIAWRVVAGALLGAFVAAQMLGGLPWWEHLTRGSFAAGVLLLAAGPEAAVPGRVAQCLHGVLVGALVVVIRLADPDQPDGVIFAVLLGALFAPLLDRALAWRPRHA